HEGKVFSALQRAVRAALVADSPVPQMRRSGGAPPQMAPSTTSAPSFFSRSAFSGKEQESYTAPPDAAAPRQAPPALKVVGQVKLTYIVAESPDGMYLVDQHAAHERVLFDQIIAKAAQRSPDIQPLLAPAMVELTPGQLEVLRNQSQFLHDYGFDLESFGENSYLLRAVPSLLTDQDPRQALVDVLDLVAFEGLLRQREDILAASIACHSAIRAGKSLTEAEMRALLEQLEATDNPHTCPHGRPTLIHFSSYNMEREFGRR
ncbi:MAG: DNA mismatch repair protein MutL, partial [Dehalococcoidia bacterium]